MYLDNSTCEEYLSGVKSFIAAAEVDKLNWHLSAICCPCIDCENVRMFVRPGATGLLTDIEYSRVRDSSYMYLTSFVTIRIGVELAAVQRKLSDCVVVGLQ